MDYLDFVLFPIYLLLFYLWNRYRAKKIENPLLRKYFLRGFYIRAFSAFAFTIFLVYISPGDSYVYFMESENIYKQTLGDVTTIDKMIFTQAKHIDPSLFLTETGGSVMFGNENNYMPVRVAVIFNFLSFGKYIITNLFFSMLAFEGCWRLYKFFYDQYPALHKELAIGVLYFPTFIFWSSGISKEALCIAGIGFITYGIYCIFIKHTKLIASTVLVLLFGYLLMNVKIYILVSYVPFLLYFVVTSNLKKVKSKLLRTLMGPAVILVSFLVFILVIVNNDDKLGSYAVEGLAETMQKQQNNFQMQENISESNFSLGATFDGSTFGLVKVAPMAIGATLFRPFIWETRKFSEFLSSIESLMMILLTMYVLAKAGPVNFVKWIFRNHLVTYCFFFAIVFSLFVGATTTNFGSLVRYKIPALPFYFVSMIVILHLSRQAKTARSIPV